MAAREWLPWSQHPRRLQKHIVITGICQHERESYDDLLAPRIASTELARHLHDDVRRLYWQRSVLFKYWRNVWQKTTVVIVVVVACSESANLRRDRCSVEEKRGGALLRVIVYQSILSGNVNEVEWSGAECGKDVILDPQPDSYQHRNLLSSRGSPLAHVWSTAVNAFVRILHTDSDWQNDRRQTDRTTDRQAAPIT